MVHAEVSEAKCFPKRRGDIAVFAFAAKMRRLGIE